MSKGIYGEVGGEGLGLQEDAKERLRAEGRSDESIEMIDAIAQMGQGLLVPVKDGSRPTETYDTLASVVEKVIRHIKVVDMRLVSSVYIRANIDLDGNISKEDTGIELTISAR